jgi:hypothetical protein
MFDVRAFRFRVIGEVLASGPPAPRASRRGWRLALAWVGFLGFWLLVPVAGVLAILPSWAPPVNGAGDEDLAVVVAEMPGDPVFAINVLYDSWVGWHDGTTETLYVEWVTTEAHLVPNDVVINVWGDGTNRGSDWGCQSSKPPGGEEQGNYYYLASFPHRASADTEGSGHGFGGDSASITTSVEGVENPYEGNGIWLGGVPPEAKSTSEYGFSISCIRTKHNDITHAPRVLIEVPHIQVGAQVCTLVQAVATINYDSGWNLDSEVEHFASTLDAQEVGYARFSNREESPVGPRYCGPGGVIGGSFTVANPEAQRVVGILELVGLLVLGAWAGIAGGALAQRLIHWPRRARRTAGAEAPAPAAAVIAQRQRRPVVKPSAVGRRRSRRRRPQR